MSSARRLTVELPEGAADPDDDVTLAGRLRLLWILDRVRTRAISTGRGAELAAMPVGRFLEVMSRHGIGPFDFDSAELDAELLIR